MVNDVELFFYLLIGHLYVFCDVSIQLFYLFFDWIVCLFISGV